MRVSVSYHIWTPTEFVVVPLPASSTFYTVVNVVVNISSNVFQVAVVVISVSDISTLLNVLSTAGRVMLPQQVDLRMHLSVCRCEVCGPVDQFQCHEVWRFYEGYQVLKLMGFVPYHPDVCAVKRLGPCTPDNSKGMQHANKILQLMNE